MGCEFGSCPTLQRALSHMGDSSSWWDNDTEFTRFALRPAAPWRATLISLISGLTAPRIAAVKASSVNSHSGSKETTVRKLKKLEIKKVTLQHLDKPTLDEIVGGNLSGPTLVAGGRCGATAGSQGCSVVVDCLAQASPD
jgi:hypothetical protein